MNKTKKAYDEILNLIRKHKDLVMFDIERLENDAKNHLLGVELVEDYGYKINPKLISSTSYQRLGENIAISFMDGERKSIPWPDDDRQPENETLLLFEYPTGAYFFGEEYHKDYFSQFFNELKSYGPKFTDTRNHKLYFDLKTGAKVFNEYPSILKKYRDQYAEFAKQKKIEKMKLELAKLEGTTA